MNKEEILNKVINIVQNMEWGVVDNSIDARELIDKLNLLKSDELIDQQTASLKDKLHIEERQNEMLIQECESLKSEIESLKAKHKKNIKEIVLCSYRAGYNNGNIDTGLTDEEYYNKYIFNK